MKKTTERLLLEVWREACRHIEISDSTALISQLLAQRMPMARLLVRRFDRKKGEIETVATGQLGGVKARHEIDRQSMAASAIRKLAVWCAAGEIVRRTAAEPLPTYLQPVVSSHLKGELLVGPLVSEHQTLGALIVEAPPPQRLGADHRHVFGQLLEPFAAALENDTRLHELNVLREAAEADKRRLLVRLGREDLSEAVIGAERGLRPVMERVNLVSRSDVPVLLLGETGSGKEVVARTIHNRSLRSDKPFIRVNCGAIPPDLIDSELFGHEKGSFTGAAALRRGWFERADEGTLFLDEIGELPPAAQVRLLRIVQERTFERVGGEQSIKADVRIIAATHRDLAAMVQNGTFREDLWYRLAVFPIVIPPLREHREDIAELAGHFAHRAATRFGLPPVMPTAHDLAMLTAYDWPGNVRELAAVMDRAAILGNGDRLEVDKALGFNPDPAAAAGPSATDRSRGFVASLDDAIRGHIELALKACVGRIEGPHGVAAMLKINPHTLRSKMRKLGVAWRGFRNR